jgi:hypothetical protein
VLLKSIDCKMQSSLVLFNALCFLVVLHSAHGDNIPGNVYYGNGQFVGQYEPFAKRDVKRTKRADDVNQVNDVLQTQATMIQALQAEMAALKTEVAALKQYNTNGGNFDGEFWMGHWKQNCYS